MNQDSSTCCLTPQSNAGDEIVCGVKLELSASASMTAGKKHIFSFSRHNRQEAFIATITLSEKELKHWEHLNLMAAEQSLACGKDKWMSLGWVQTVRVIMTGQPWPAWQEHIANQRLARQTTCKETFQSSPELYIEITNRDTRVVTTTYKINVLKALEILYCTCIWFFPMKS